VSLPMIIWATGAAVMFAHGALHHWRNPGRIQALAAHHDVEGASPWAAIALAAVLWPILPVLALLDKRGDS